MEELKENAAKQLQRLYHVPCCFLYLIPTFLLSCLSPVSPESAFQQKLLLWLSLSTYHNQKKPWFSLFPCSISAVPRIKSQVQSEHYVDTDIFYILIKKD